MCVLVEVQMANVGVEKFMMPCLEIPGGYLVVQLALQSRHARHSLTHTQYTLDPCIACVCLLKRHGIKERVRSKKHGEAEIHKVRKERSFWYLAFSSRWFSVSSIPRGFLCHTKVPRSTYVSQNLQNNNMLAHF